MKKTAKLLKQLRDSISTDKYLGLVIALYVGMWIMIAGTLIALVASMAR